MSADTTGTSPLCRPISDETPISTTRHRAQAAGEHHQSAGIRIHSRSDTGLAGAVTPSAATAIPRIRNAQIVRHFTLFPARPRRPYESQRISSAGVTPITASPDRMTVAVAATRARRACVSPAGQPGETAASHRPCPGSTAYESRPPSHREKMQFCAVLLQLPLLLPCVAKVPGAGST